LKNMAGITYIPSWVAEHNSPLLGESGRFRIQYMNGENFRYHLK